MDNNIAEAVNWATKRLAKSPSTGTIKQYMVVIKRLKPQMELGIFPGASNNRNTRSVERSAFRYWASSLIAKKFESDPTYVKKIYATVKKVDADARKALQEYHSGKEFQNKQIRRSKRPSLTGLKDNWREQLIKVSYKSKYADAIRVMAICGCRPSEVEKGIELKRYENTVTIKIIGAKCSDKTDGGQAWRSLVFDANHPIIGNIPEGSYQAKASAVEDAISHYGRKVSTNKKNPISAYSLRHAAASNFKASGLTIEEIAAALGHQSTATMAHYGTKSRGSGMLILKSVTAASPVRNKSIKPKAKYKT